MESISERAEARAKELDGITAYLLQRGSFEAAGKAAARAQEAREIAALARDAERHLGRFAGPSSATLPPPPMPKPAEKTKARRKVGRPSYADRLMARAS